MSRSADVERHGWTEREERFVAAYVRHRNAARAVREAGYDVGALDFQTHAAMGHEILQRPKVQMAAKVLIAEAEARKSQVVQQYEITELNILQHVAYQAFGNIADFVDDKGRPDLDAIAAASREQMASIESIEVTPGEFGDKVKLKMKPTLPALVELAKRFQLFKDTLDINISVAQVDAIREARARAALIIDHDEPQDAG